MSRCLVTGAKGFIGSHLVSFLNNNKTIKCDSRPGMGVWLPDEIDIHFHDLSAVYHLGAISSTTETDTYKIAGNNILFSCMLLESCIQNNVPFVYASSASVYGLGDNGFSESSITTPLNYYAISKSSFDKIVEQKIKDNPKAKIVGLRYFNVYGSGEDHKNDMASPVHKFTKQANETGTIKIFEGSEKYLRDFIHVSDVVRITEEAVNLPSGIYNVGTGTPRSFLDVAEIIADLSGAEIKEIPFPGHLVGKYQEHTCSDNKKINNAGCHPRRVCLEEGIRQVYFSMTSRH